MYILSLSPFPLSFSPSLQIAERQAELFMQAGEPVMAACALLAVTEPLRAVQVLVEGDVPLLAMGIVTALQLGGVDYVYHAAAARCESLGLWDEALLCLQMVCCWYLSLFLLHMMFFPACALFIAFYC